MPSVDSNVSETESDSMACSETGSFVTNPAFRNNPNVLGTGGLMMAAGSSEQIDCQSIRTVLSDSELDQNKVNIRKVIEKNYVKKTNVRAKIMAIQD